jgi:transcriptional regulator with XRE-family HTH domain
MTGNPQLRALRQERGWTQQELADQVQRMAWLRRNEQVGVNADMVSKWERGKKLPIRLYREMLGLVFGTDAQGLGFGGPAAPGVGGRGEIDGNSLIETLGGAASLFDQLGIAGSILQPRMPEVWKDELVQRRAMLKLMALATAASMAPVRDRELSRLGKVTPEEVRDLDHLADRYQALYHTAAPAALMTPVVAHLGTMRDFLHRGASATLLRRLFANRARVAVLAGRLAFCEMGDSLAGRGYYNLALESAREAEDHLQAAAALGHIAVIPASEFCYSAAFDYLSAASRQVCKRPDGRVASWLSAVESEMRANAGKPAEALAAIDRAREQLANPGLVADLPWLDYHDPTRLAGFAGYALLRDKQLDAAKALLTDAAAHLPQTAVKQKAVFLADIATVDLAAGDLEQACASAAIRTLAAVSTASKRQRTWHPDPGSRT